MMIFPTHSDCKDCSLFESAKHPGIPTRSIFDNQKTTKDRAALFIGQSPGFKEDENGKSFIGYTGQLLEKFVKASRLRDYADIFLANACRCKPPQGGDESQKQIRTCRKYLAEDIQQLQKYYKEIVIVALGAKACYSVAHISSLNKGFKQQGMKSVFLTEDIEQTPRVFFTYHPAMLHPARKPALVRVVQTHFELLVRYLQGKFIPNELKIVPLVGESVPKVMPKRVSVDIETYGILKGKEQTVFNPHKSKLIDGIDYPNQIVTVSFAWRDEEGELKTALYIWKDLRHRRIIRTWLRRICTEKSHTVPCLGQNIKFDLMYLAASGDIELQYWISPNRLVVDDVMIWSFLLFEQQPEKGQKELAALYGVADYSGLEVTGKSGSAKSCYDKRLHYYNCLDSAVALVLAEEMEERIKIRYGKDSPKLSDTCAQMRNVAVWDTFDLDLNGSTLDVLKLKKYHNEENSRCEEILDICQDIHGIKIAGKGSDSPLRDFMLHCVQEAGLLEDKRVIYSPKTKKISIGVENVNLVKDYLPVGRDLTILSLFQEFKERSKTVNTYTRPLLFDPRKGIVKKDGTRGTVYPSWYPIPSYYERGGSSEDKQGGQIQGRFSCKRPGRQTEPHPIRDCSVSRWPQGTIVEYDVSQDHLRMAALLSGDPFLMEAYQKKGENIHNTTALTLFPDADISAPSWKKSNEYRLSKSLNFLTIFKGGAKTYQSTALHDVGIEVDLDFCTQAIRKWFTKYHVYKNWQDEMIAKATRQGYLVLPTGWSRTFGPPGSDISAFEGEVLNFLHQTPCAQVTQSSEYQIICKLKKYHLRSVLCLYIYDALFLDVYPGEEKDVDEIVDEAMTHPPLLSVFERWVGRSIPWAYEKKEYVA